MDKITKMKKISIAVIGIIIFALLSSSIVKAEETAETTETTEDSYLVFAGDPNAAGGTFKPYKKDGSWVFCIQHHTSYKADLAKDRYDANKVEDKSDKFCTYDTDDKKVAPWPEGTYMKYTFAENVDAKQHQDLAYIFASEVLYEEKYEEYEKKIGLSREEALKEALKNKQETITIDNLIDQIYKDNIVPEGSIKKIDEEQAKITTGAGNEIIITTETTKYESNNMQNVIWSTDINIGKPPEELSESGSASLNEATQFKQFYSTIHGGTEGADIFESLIKGEATNVKVIVDQVAGTYTVGPLQVQYPNGQYNGQNKFSWITGISAITDAGKYPVTVLDNVGNEITMASLGENGTETLNGKVFYIKFSSKTATNTKVQIDFKYLESCSATMKTYTGKQYKRFWEKHEVSSNCINELSHYHGTVHAYDLDANGKQIPCVHTKDGGTVYEWVLKEEYVKDTQKMMHIIQGEGVGEDTQNEYSAKKNYKTASIVFPTGDEGIDLTMKLEGYVFLDQDQGKVNTGNNLLDGGEGLGGIEVSLYDSDNNLIGIKLSGGDGKYSFDKLNSQKKYYVQFVYNGMLYTNVQCANLDLNPTNGSKATEDAQGHAGNRQAFNSKFAEIGSFPNNYGNGRIAYKQEEIASLFKSIASGVVSNGGNEVTSSSNSKEQFAIDCRIKAYTVKKYPLIDQFVIDDKPAVIAGKTYEPIYFGKYDQLHVNLGIKARPTIDFALSKDVLNAQVTINEKTETYEYDSRTATSAFKVGIREEDYLNGLRGMYMGGSSFTSIDNKEDLNSNKEYYLNMRSEEITNNKIETYKNTLTQNKKINEQYEISKDYDLSDKLKIFVTYKLSIKNQSSASGSITEIVDYYDPRYEFAGAYVGDSKGNSKGSVGSSTSSKYGANSQYQSSSGAYKTIYLTPPETTLSRGDGVDATDQYIYVKFELINPESLLTQELITKQKTLNMMNLAEINGYKTSEGLIDIDSNPGNFNISNIPELTYQNIKNSGAIYEDDTSRAPALIYKLSDSRTIEGVVFEDNTEVKNNTREYDGLFDKNKEKGINGVIVQLVEIKKQKMPNGNVVDQMIVRAETKTKHNAETNQDGWYGFTGYVPGDYTIRYIYGADDDTAMAKSSYIKGLNENSYNGQDYQATKYYHANKDGIGIQTYTTDTKLIDKYNDNNKNKHAEENKVEVNPDTKIDKYNNNGYWYTDYDEKHRYSDARDDANRVLEVQDYSRKTYDREITNHKVEVFNSYVNPQPDHINEEYNRELANELERRTYRYAYTPMVEIEVEYATQIVSGTKEDYSHHIKGVDFGIVERPKQELWIDEDIAKIKLTLANGTVIFDDVIKEGENLQWINNGDENDITDKNELVNVIMDEELINGAQIEITYNIRLQNRSENNAGKTHAKNILNYVSNNLNFDAEAGENNQYWEVVSRNEVQNGEKSTLVNNNGAVDLTTQSVILKAKEGSPLLSELREGEMTGVVPLTLKKVLSAENSSDDLRYTNLTEIVEIVNEFGRYDKDATPGNQRTDLNPREHDAAGATRYTDPDSKNNPPDTVVVVTPPTGSNYNYYTYIIIGIELAAILLVGVIIVKKLLAKKQQ